jgi:hypothetical protein
MVGSPPFALKKSGSKKLEELGSNRDFGLPQENGVEPEFHGQPEIAVRPQFFWEIGAAASTGRKREDGVRRAGIRVR